MKSFLATMTALLAAGLSYAAPTDAATTVQACDCVHNNDAGRWQDSKRPSGRLQDLCNIGGGCHDAIQGRMCVAGDMSKCSCAITSAQEWESHHGDWFLWSAVTCGGLSVTIT